MSGGEFAAVEWAALVLMGLLGGVVMFRATLPTWAVVVCMILEAATFAFLIWHILRF